MKYGAEGQKGQKSRSRYGELPHFQYTAFGFPLAAFLTFPIPETHFIDDDDDLDAFLDAAASESLEAKQAIEAEKAAEEAAAASAAAEADDGGDDEGDEGGAAAKKKKKKKPRAKTAGKEAAPKSAMAQAILAQQEAKKKEDDRVRALQEAEDARIRAEEEAAETERRKAEEQKEAKKKKQADKIAAQKAAGTYMTKAEKDKAKKAAARLEALKRSGMFKEGLPPVPVGTASKAPSPPKPVVKNEAPKLPEPEPEPEPELEPQAEPEPVAAADDDDGDSDDDWENAGEALAEQISEAIINGDGEEDLLAVESRKEQEKLKKLGIERARREDERRAEEAKARALQDEMARAESLKLLKKQQSRERRLKRDDDAMAARSPDKLRSPISVIMGHVDTGKTSLLDKIRDTNVQDGEEGGITQQIGATQFSKEMLVEKVSPCKEAKVEIPGLLMIDTPGHESFTNLRNRGSTLCDIAILVIDLMHGLEQQTIESIEMLTRKKAPFVVALNKVDRCYGWKSVPNTSIRDALKRQDENTMAEFRDRSQHVMLQLSEKGYNTSLFWENESPEDTISLIPTSAVTGEGVPDLLHQLIDYTQTRIREKLQFVDIVQCTVLEVKDMEGFGITMDVVLVNGTLREGDTIVVNTMQGAKKSTVRALLTPPPNRETRVKSEHIHHTSIQGATGLRIIPQKDVGDVLTGTAIQVIRAGDDEDDVMEDCKADLEGVFKRLTTDGAGVTVHAAEIGPLEALLQFLQDECKPAIPVGAWGRGTIKKEDVMRAGRMHDKGMPEFATILGFDVDIDPAAERMATELNVRIFTARIIYHLFDQFNAYMGAITAERKAEAEKVAVFPSIVKIMPQFIFNSKDPIVVGMEVLQGTLRVGTPLTIPNTNFTDIGRVVSIENNRKEVQSAKKGSQVSVKISNEHNPNQTYGRQFDAKHNIYSKISRVSINALKEHFRTDVTMEEWKLLKDMKSVFNID